ncbi:hypothetical protein G7K_2351-t1 [Saitoella complicata NRRL Y-17804]|uniref:PCI domain-containing protein n=2 Tax=Saitoella complicata (strain BCRC 22490 / CBS 7301 / JCM 7358 / NBRC 10748 / NRRL Y-17804) TaxID=698492 RepID=A0A0E9NEP1_SAICN|nr:hypothetical protein G7K_2351-t1 [Saitoella complicata NRRL Y-17804]
MASETPKKVEDVEMGDVNDALKPDVAASVVADIKQNLALVEKAVSSLEPRLTLRALRNLSSLRKRLNADILAQAVQEVYPSGQGSQILQAIGKGSEDVSMDVDSSASKEIVAEADVYVQLLTQIHLLDTQQIAAGVAFSTVLVEQLRSLNRRSLDQIAARVYFYYARFFELEGKLTETRTALLAAQRTATLRHDTDIQATVLTLLLRSYLAESAYEQADKLVAKTTFPEHASNNLVARYLYYLGRIRAIQLDYTGAHGHLVGAVRKAPQIPNAAGFLQAAQKLSIVVQLLMGDIPHRALFREPMLEKALIPYLDIVRAVRVGDLNLFEETTKKYAEGFKKDGNYSLIGRLRNNVIKTGIRSMSLSYSRISLRDICLRLHLDSEESAEYIVAKAIRDGVIEATINHEKGYMQSLSSTDVYATLEPMQAFHDRIKFSMQLRNGSVKAMRYPMNADKKDKEEAEKVREREKELASEIENGGLDEDDDDAGADMFE